MIQNGFQMFCNRNANTEIQSCHGKKLYNWNEEFSGRKLASYLARYMAGSLEKTTFSILNFIENNL